MLHGSRQETERTKDCLSQAPQPQQLCSDLYLIRVERRGKTEADEAGMECRITDGTVCKAGSEAKTVEEQ